MRLTTLCIEGWGQCVPPYPIPGIFALMEPMQGAIESFIELTKYFETYLLSTAPWNNPSAWSDKLLWTKKYLGEHAFKRLILTHHKNLNTGDYLIDDRSSLCSAPSHWSSPAQSEALLFFGGRCPGSWSHLYHWFSNHCLESSRPSKRSIIAAVTLA